VLAGSPGYANSATDQPGCSDRHHRTLADKAAIALGGSSNRAGMRVAEAREWAEGHLDDIFFECALPGAHDPPIYHDDRIEDAIAARNHARVVVGVERHAAIA